MRNSILTLRRRLIAVVLSQLLLFTISPFLLTSCNGDDDEKLSVPELIVGSWIVDSYEVQNPNNDEYTVYIDHFYFGRDKTFTVYYGLAPGQVEAESPRSGIYEAGDAYLRLEYDNGQDKPQKVLCEILSYNENFMQIIYRHPDSDIVAYITVLKVIEEK